MSFVEPKFAAEYESPTAREITTARSQVTFWSNRGADPSRTRQDRADANAKANEWRVKLWNLEHAPTEPDDPSYDEDDDTPAEETA